MKEEKRGRKAIPTIKSKIAKYTKGNSCEYRFNYNTLINNKAVIDNFNVYLRFVIQKKLVAQIEQTRDVAFRECFESHHRFGVGNAFNFYHLFGHQFGQIVGIR